MAVQSYDAFAGTSGTALTAHAAPSLGAVEFIPAGPLVSCPNLSLMGLGS